MSQENEVSRRTALATAGLAGVALASAGVSAFGQDPPQPANVGNKKQIAEQPIRRWQSAGPFSTADEAANFLNLDPPQGPGEASLSCDPGGRFHLIWYH
jgi:hypothetical protein